MRKVIGIGETVLDIIFKDNQPVGAVPGGSVFNAMISLGRCGVASTMLTDAGRDRIGDQVVSFLSDNGVCADYVQRFAHGQSPVSLAFLDEANNAQYMFYRDCKVDRQDINIPDLHADDIVLIGSYYALDPAVRQQVVALLDQARAAGAIIYYDINFRPSHRTDVMKVTPNLLDNLDYADIVRGSVDDFEVLYRKQDPETIYKAEISFYCKRFICTRGAQPAVVLADGGVVGEYPVDTTDTVSTIGAGDNFNAGFIYSLLRQGITRDHLDRGLTQQQWDGLIADALAFAAESCKSIYNYISVDFGNNKQLPNHI